MCPQVKAKPWKTPGLLLLLLALAAAGVVAGGLLGFTHGPPKVSSSSGPGQGHRHWEVGGGQHIPAFQWSQGPEQRQEAQAGGGVRNLTGRTGGVSGAAPAYPAELWLPDVSLCCRCSV